MLRIYIRENKFVKMKKGKISLCNANVKKYYKRKKALQGVKEMALVNSSFFPFTVFFAPSMHQEAQPRRRETGKRKRWYDESEKLAVNIERVIRSLKNTWTIIKPTCGVQLAREQEKTGYLNETMEKGREQRVQKLRKKKKRLKECKKRKETKENKEERWLKKKKK